MLSLALVGWLIPASNTVLHASLSSALFSLRQIVISSALGTNALQSLSTSGAHAKRCASVPCEKEGAGEAVADRGPATRTTAPRTSAEVSSIYSGFLRSSEDLPSVIEVDTRHHHGRYKYTLAGARTCRETSAFVAFDPAAVLPLSESGSAAHRADMRGCPVRSSSTSGRTNHQVSARLSKRWERHQR